MTHDDDRLDGIANGDHDGLTYNDSRRWRRSMTERREFMRPDLCYATGPKFAPTSMAEAFHGKMICVADRRFMLVAFDRGSTMGVVIDEHKKPILGWSRSDNSVHVIGRKELEWRGSDLEETIRIALVMLVSNQQPDELS